MREMALQDVEAKTRALVPTLSFVDFKACFVFVYVVRASSQHVNVGWRHCCVHPKQIKHIDTCCVQGQLLCTCFHFVLLLCFLSLSV